MFKENENSNPKTKELDKEKIKNTQIRFDSDSRSLQAFVLSFAKVLVDFQLKDRTAVNLDKYLNKQDNSQQSGEQSKSNSEIMLETDDEVQV